MNSKLYIMKEVKTNFTKEVQIYNRNLLER